MEESTRMEIQKITNQILKSHRAIQDLEEKSNNLAEINDKKYMQIWDMNIKTANELVDKVRVINYTDYNVWYKCNIITIAGSNI